MYVITVIPISRGIAKDSLSYFSPTTLTPGLIVDIPLRKQIVPGIVVSSISAETLKAEIKDLPFQVRKIEPRRERSVFFETYIEAAKMTAEYFAANIGAVLSSIVPKALFTLDTEPKEYEKKVRGRFEELALQMPEAERFDIYKSIIRESLAKKESIFILVSTEDKARECFGILSKGIENYAVLLTSDPTEKKLLEITKKIEDAKRHYLFVGNGRGFAFLPPNTGTIIVEKESDKYFKTERRPFVDYRTFAIFMAKALGARILYGDDLLSIGMHERVERGAVIEYSRLMARDHHEIQTLIVDMTKLKEEKGFKVISPELEEMIRYVIKKNQRLFIFNARRGLSPQTICYDCGKTVVCNSCESPIVLHEKKQGRFFVCHHCAETRPAEELCQKCHGWNLKSLGSGVELVAKLVEEISGVKPYRIDRDSTKTKSAEKKVAEEFLLKKGILIGTEIALANLPQNSIEFSAVSSLDSLFSLPDFTMNEHIMHLILAIKKKATACILVQTRDPKSAILEHGLGGNLTHYVKEELEARKRYGYPPFKRFIKLTITEDKDKIKGVLGEIARALEGYDPIVFPAFIKTIRGKNISHILIKIDPKKWPGEELLNILLSLPPSIEVRVDPQSLL